MNGEQAQLLESMEEGCIHLPARALPASTPCRLLISLDYDGTLRREDAHAVEPAFFELMQALRPAGVRWGINTGRNLRKLSGELLGFPYMPDFICTCERYAYVADEHGALRPMAEHNAQCHRANMELRDTLREPWQQTLARLRERCPALRWEIAADDPLSIEAADSATMDEIMPHIAHMATGHVAIQRAGRFMRLSDARFTKGSALRCVQQLWHVPEHSLFLMGDGHNDIDAFRHFPRAYCAAPATAHPDVLHWLQAHGGYISPEPGVLHAISHWCALQGHSPAC